MRIVRFDVDGGDGSSRLGVLSGNQVVDVTHLAGGAALDSQARLVELVVRWAELAPALERAARSGGDARPLESVRLLAPVARPGQLVCMAGNYREPGRAEPTFNAFLKANTSVVGTGETVQLPDAEASVFHFEPELALVIGKRAAHLSADDAMDHVFAYTQFIDVSARGLPGGFFLGKSWHTFAPLGPVLVTADEVQEPNNLCVQLSVNGTTRHEYSTADMGRHVPYLLSDLTKVLTLEPGDVVATGTHHVQLSPIQHGDRVRMTIAGFGPALEVSVHDPLKRTWQG